MSTLILVIIQTIHVVILKSYEDACSLAEWISELACRKRDTRATVKLLVDQDGHYNGDALP